ncbi:MarR family winged helix-turn-helix transcriptional regulator [Nocardia camponoti]|uniref:MarR family transcriptional regulator n=1 Tax=Nocardia camponoti TaxID=1616106 RepID=A0A917VDA4_9NOCA|nr:MarR family winged helix-turn-helix transcriptional regulator [Nocardia camponoti]GGK64913.1 MarR family transcriptional regulator [Nocardia camponoti]
MARWLTESEQKTWQAYITLRQRLDAALSAGLASAGLSMADYELLVPLSAAQDGRMRAKDLAAEVCWEKSRLSKQLARMAARGLIDRRAAADDARGIVVSLTPAGRELVEQVAPEHVALVRELFIDGMSEREAAAIESLSERIVGAIADR